MHGDFLKITPNVHCFPSPWHCWLRDSKRDGSDNVLVPLTVLNTDRDRHNRLLSCFHRAIYYNRCISFCTLIQRRPSRFVEITAEGSAVLFIVKSGSDHANNTSGCNTTALSKASTIPHVWACSDKRHSYLRVCLSNSTIP